MPEENPYNEPEQTPETEPEEKQPGKVVRSQELVHCPMCNKMDTPKTLKYSHKKTRGVVKTEPERTPLKQVRVTPQYKGPTPDIEDAPKLVRRNSVKPSTQGREPVITNDMVREYHNSMRAERIKMRYERPS
jgi:D-arabinose 1-dehydrogenase-like Zn-dependent alcohol dehydrogenase